MLADFAGWVFYLADRRSRAVALANLEAVFGSEMSPERRRQVTRKSLQVFARSFLELFWTPRLNQKDLGKFISFENPDTFAAILAGKSTCPTIGITPHFGNFEWGSALFAFSGLDGYILTQRFKNDRLTPIFQQIREKSGHRIVTREGSMLRFMKALRRGKHVGILIDLTLKMNDPGVIISTFGLRMRTTMIHALLHQRTGARLLPFITLTRPDGGYSVRLLDPLQFPADLLGWLRTHHPAASRAMALGLQALAIPPRYQRPALPVLRQSIGTVRPGTGRPAGKVS